MVNYSKKKGGKKKGGGGRTEKMKGVKEKEWLNKLDSWGLKT